MKEILKYITLLLLVATMLTGCGNLRQKKRNLPDSVPVTAVVVSNGSTEYSAYTYSGYLAESYSSLLSFQTGGKLIKVYVSEGSKVKKGDKLAEIDSTQSVNALKSAEATLAQAQDGYDRLKMVYDSGSISEVKWIEMETKLEQAKSMAQGARKNLDDCTLTAPFNGIITSRTMEVGSHVLPSNAFIKIINTDSMLVVVDVPENDISAINEGQCAKIQVLALNNRQLWGKIVNKNVDANQISHTYQVKIAVPNTDGNLMAGMVCKASIETAKDETNIIIPYQAVQLMPDGRYVWCIVDGKSVRKKVETKGFANNGVIITQGLEPGDSVIVEGRQKVYEGGRVKAKP
ncbi:MAG: efflux RND transporter periplasmic adaptor subunit [Paludibacteraceae bacterium]|nr:efflux RND transporter periplasmic adaptor subunit [Paludibacteraceae bacterium]